MIVLIGISVLGAYASNKFCHRVEDDIPADYLKAGAKPNETANWHVVAIEMMDRNIEEAPKNAPQAFQIEYLEKIDEIRRAHKFGPEVLEKAYQTQLHNIFMMRKQMDVDELAERDDLDIAD